MNRYSFNASIVKHFSCSLLFFQYSCSVLGQNKMNYKLVFICIFIYPSICRPQILSLYEAVNISLKNNKTILRTAEQNMLSAQANYNLSKALYGFSTVLNVQYNRSSAQNRALSYDKSAVYSEYQQLLPAVTIQKTFLTPLGSRLQAGLGLQSSIMGLNTFSYETRPNLYFNFTQPLSLAGIRSGHSDLDQAELSYKKAVISFRRQKENLVFSVIQSYFQLWRMERQSDQNAKDFESTKKLLEIARLKLKTGSIAESEVLNLEVQNRLAEDQLLLSRLNLEQKKISFLRLLGLPLNTSLILIGPTEPDSLSINLKEALQIAVNNRSDMLQYGINKNSAKIARQVTLASSFPQLNINATLNFRSLYEYNFYNSLNFPNYGWSITAGLSYAFYDGGKRELKNEIARLNIEVLNHNQSILEEEIKININNLIKSIKLNMRRLYSLKLNLNAAEQSLAIAELKFGKGQISAIEMDAIRKNYNSAVNSLNDAKIALIINHAQLAREMGILLKWVNTLK